MKRLSWVLVLCFAVLHAGAFSAESYVELKKLRSTYGGAVAIVGSDILIAEPSGFSTPGMVHVYRKEADGSWVESQTLVSSNSSVGDRFGSSLSGSGDHLFIGATEFNENAGIVYVFEKGNDGTWRESGTLQSGVTETGDRFGATVAVAGEWGMVAAPERNGRAGAVYVFHYAESFWREVQSLGGDTVDEGHEFGAALAIRENRFAVGAPGTDENRGAVYVYEHAEGASEWSQTHIIRDREESSQDRFGTSVAIDLDRIAVGVPMAKQFTGRLEVLVHRRSSWYFFNQAAPEATEGQRVGLGSALVFDGRRLWASAPFENFRKGMVVDYSHDFKDVVELTSAESDERSGFGSSIAVSGDIAVIGMPGHDYGEGIAAIFERSDDNWNQTVTVYRDLGSHQSVFNDRTDCENGAAREFKCSNVDLVSFIPNNVLGMNRGVRLNDVWGWTDPETGKEYGLIAHMESAVFIDLSTPESPVILGELPRTDGSPGSTWRDIKVYKDHAFIVADGAREHGMQVFDLTRLRNVENPPVIFEPNMTYHGIASAHNIVINEDSGYAYTVGGRSGGDTCGGALHMINIQDPTNPSFVGCFVDQSTGRGGSGATHDAQCVVYNGPDAEHRGKEICIGSNGTAISIADVSNKENPVPISTGTYPNSAYVHQGWLTDDHTFFYQNDEGDEIRGVVDRTRTMIWDVTDLDDPEMIGEFFGDSNSTDHNLYVHGDYMYQANNASGLRIIDVRDRTNPVEVGFFDTTPYGKNVAGFDGTWSTYPFFDSGMILLTSRREGLFIVKKREIDI